MQLEPPSHERARFRRAQLCYKSLMPVLANRGACRQPGTGHAGAWPRTPGRRQSGKPKVARRGCPRRAGFSQALSDTAMSVPAAHSEHFLAWDTAPATSQGITGVFAQKCSVIDGQCSQGQVFGTALCTVRAYSMAAVLCSFSLCILDIGDVQKQGMEVQSLS